MAEGDGRKRSRKGAPPIPLEPVDLLAGLAPDVELEADPVPSALDPDDDGPATITVAEVGKLLRSGDDTVRRLIRSPELRPRAADPDAEPVEVDRAGVPPRSPDRPGE